MSREMEPVFARVELALAELECLRSRDCWSRSERVWSGRHLDSAAQYLQQASTWARVQLDERDRDVIRRAEELSTTLRANEPVDSAAIGASLDATESVANALNRKLDEHM